MREGASEVSRLLEMCADDASARRHGSGVLLSGLITMCRATPAGPLRQPTWPCSPAPTGSLCHQETLQ